MKVYRKKPIRYCGQHVNASPLGTQVFQKALKSGLTLENDPLVPGPQRDAFTIKIFEQWNRVFT